MSRKLKPATFQHVADVQRAVDLLRGARTLLANAGCPNSAARVRSALKSAEGALRHVERREHSTAGA